LNGEDALVCEIWIGIARKRNIQLDHTPAGPATGPAEDARHDAINRLEILILGVDRKFGGLYAECNRHVFLLLFG
jgi:hypothetical protein